MVDVNKVIKSHFLWLCGERGDRADLSGADLSGADLSGADLSDANLSGANLRGAGLSGADLKVYQSGLWTAYVQPDHIRIGCQYFRTEEWEAFSDEEIDKMHPLALEYWKENKHIVLSIARSLNKEISA
jgi:hypothetical protein